MSERIREQISAFLDGELPRQETDLLLKRLTRDAELRHTFGRYGLIGEACRGDVGTRVRADFAAKIGRAIAAEAPLADGTRRRRRAPRLWRHAASAAVAAGVAVVAVFALQQRADTPTLGLRRPQFANTLRLAPRAQAPAVVADASHEALSYTVPAAQAEVPAALPPARLTNYVFAHSEYTSFLGQRSLLSGLIAEPDTTTMIEPPVTVVPAKSVHSGGP